MLNKYFFIVFIICSCNILKQNKDLPFSTLESIQYTSDSCYARGLLIKDSILYTSNSNGKIYAYSFINKSSKSYENTSFKTQELRDLIFISNHLVGMQSGTEGFLFQLKSDQLIAEKNNLWPNVFLDGIDGNENSAFMIGDPINGYFSLFYYSNNSWKSCEEKIIAAEGEAGFAASGTNVQVLNDSTFIFVSGGSQSRFFKTSNFGKKWSSTNLPFETGEGIGAFSICFKNDLIGVVVGGNYTEPLNSKNNSFYILDGGKNWKESKINPNGYRSCVHFKNGVFYACGTSGLDYSKDNGKTWSPISKEIYFAMISDNQYLYLTSKNGKIVKIPLLKTL